MGYTLVCYALEHNGQTFANIPFRTVAIQRWLWCLTFLKTSWSFSFFFFPKYASICGGLCLEIPLVQVSSEYWNHFTKLFPFPKIKCTLHLLFDANKGGTRNSKVQFITVELLIRTAWRLEVTMAYSLTYGQVWTKSQLIPNGSVKHVVSATGHSYETVRISKWLLCHLQRGKSHKFLAK